MGDPIHAKFLEIKRDPRRFDPFRFKYRNPSNKEAREMARQLVKGMTPNPIEIIGPVADEKTTPVTPKREGEAK